MIRDYLNWMATPKNDGIWTNRWILRSTLALYQNTDEIHLSKYEMNLYEVSINIQTMRNKQWVELISWSISEVNMTFLYVPLPTKFLNSLSSPKNVSSERFYTFTLICLWGRTHLLMLPWHVCEDQRTTHRSQYSPSPYVGPWSWTQVIGLGGKLPFLLSLLNSLVFAFLKTALETTSCNLVADILRTAKEVKSTEQFWEESLIIIPIFHARLGESRRLRTGLFLELNLL